MNMSNVTGTGPRPGERGAISIKALLGLLLAGALAFAVMKFAPVYIEQQKVVHEVNELARTAAIRGWKEDRIDKDIKRLSLEFNLPENGINLQSKSEKGVQIAISYQRNIDLLVTTYLWKVDQVALGKDL
jgi:hypothetical protein